MLPLLQFLAANYYLFCDHSTEHIIMASFLCIKPYTGYLSWLRKWRSPSVGYQHWCCLFEKSRTTIWGKSNPQFILLKKIWCTYTYSHTYLYMDTRLITPPLLSCLCRIIIHVIPPTVMTIINLIVWEDSEEVLIQILLYITLGTFMSNPARSIHYAYL